MILITIVAHLVTAWGFQVLWNHLVLNVWQLFTTVDVINTMHLSYGVFFAIAVAINLVYSPQNTKKTDSIGEALIILLPEMISKVITICLTLLVTSIVF